MYSSSWLTVVAGITLCVGGKDNFRQERAEVRYFNPKYIENAQAFTARVRRGEAYKSNITATLIKSWTNNITFEISYKTRSTPMPLKLSLKLCDSIKQKWMRDFLQSYSKMKVACPFPAGSYSIVNIELPPKNFPLPIPEGDVRVNLTHYLTDTKEMVMQISLLVHSD